MEKFRSKILVCFLAVALVMLTTPIGLKFDTENNSIEVQSNRAHAVVPVAGAAAAFLAEIAAASGLTVGEFVATVAGVTAVGTGMGIATDAGINYGNAASVNLGNLIDAADYPSWDSLSSEQQEAWGSKEYYDSAKFNSLLDAFDLGDARDRFYSSAGGNIDYTASETARLEQLGSIGTNWINNIGNSIDSIKQTFREDYKQAVGRYLYGASFASEYVYKGEGNENWQQGKEFYYKKTNQVWYNYQNLQNTSSNYYYVMASSNNVYAAVNWHQGTMVMFSITPFRFGQKRFSNLEGIDVPINSDANAFTDTQRRVCYLAKSNTDPNFINFASQTVNNNIEMTIDDYCNILYNESSGSETPGELVPDIIGYPEDISQDGDTNIFYPVTGIVPDMEWNEFTTVPEQNPGTGDEVDLTEIIQLLQRFHFTVDYNLLVQDNPLRSAVMELVSNMNKFTFYAGTGQLKVHDEGVFDAVGDLGNYLGGLLQQIQATLSGFFVTDTATDVIGDLDFPDLGDKAVDLVDTISTLAPFGAMFLISELVAILSQVGKIQTPSMVFDFNFMPDHEYDLTVDLSWLADAKPIINVACIITLIVALAGTTARLIELEAAA